MHIMVQYLVKVPYKAVKPAVRRMHSSSLLIVRQKMMKMMRKNQLLHYFHGLSKRLISHCYMELLFLLLTGYLSNYKKLT